jgi:hypothetical protein
MYSQIRKELIDASIRLDILASKNPSPEKDKVIAEMERNLYKAVELTIQGERGVKTSGILSDTPAVRSLRKV